MVKTAFLLFAVAPCVYAGSVTDAQIYNLYLSDRDGVATVLLDKAIQDDPPCALRANSFAMSMEMPYFKETLATIITALASGQKVSITGKGSCEVYNNTETLESISVGR